MGTGSSFICFLLPSYFCVNIHVYTQTNDIDIGDKDQCIF